MRSRVRAGETPALPIAYRSTAGKNALGVSAGVLVGVAVGVFVGVAVGVFVGVAVGVFVGVVVGVAVGTASTVIAPAWVVRGSGPPFRSARSTEVIVIALVPGETPTKRMEARIAVPVNGGDGFRSDTT